MPRDRSWVTMPSSREMDMALSMPVGAQLGKNPGSLWWVDSPVSNRMGPSGCEMRKTPMGMGPVQPRSQKARRRRMNTHWFDIGWLLMDGRIRTVPVDMKDTRIEPLFGDTVDVMVLAGGD